VNNEDILKMERKQKKINKDQKKKKKEKKTALRQSWGVKGKDNKQKTEKKNDEKK
jgi:hypothetical protein